MAKGIERQQDYGRTKIDDHAKTGAGWVWRKVRLLLWMIGALTLICLALLAFGAWKVST